MKFEIDIQTYEINTGSGRSTDWLKIPRIDKNDVEVLNGIGYGSTKTFGRGAKGFETYLNAITLSPTQFKVVQTQIDSGDFEETFLVIVANVKAVR